MKNSEYKIETLIHEATRFSKEFKKSSPIRQRKLSRMLLAPLGGTSRGNNQLVNQLQTKRQPTLKATNDLLRGSRDTTIKKMFDKSKKRMEINKAFKEAKGNNAIRNKIREINFGFTRDESKFQKNREMPYGQDIRTSNSAKKSFIDNQKSSFNWSDNFTGLYKNNPVEAKSGLEGLKSKFDNRNKPEFPFSDKAASGGGLYTLDSLFNRRNTNTFKNRISGNVWANGAPSTNPKAATDNIKEHYNASKFGTYTDRGTWDIPAHAEFTLPISKRKHNSYNGVSPTEFTLNQNQIKDITDLNIKRVTPTEQKNKGVFLDREWANSNPERAGQGKGNTAYYDNAINNIPNNIRK